MCSSDLVARRTHRVGAPRLDVDLVLADGLDGVDDDQRARLVGDIDGLRHGQPGTVEPRLGAETDEPGIGDGLPVGVGRQPAVRAGDRLGLDAG